MRGLQKLSLKLRASLRRSAVEREMEAELAEQHLTYGELDQHANQLAHYLLKLRVGPDVRVAICMERSPELLVALLGVLKAGGAYVPLDPAYPQERLAYMLEDSGASVLISQSVLVHNLPQNKATVLALDADWNRIAQESHHRPQVEVDPENLAYIIYTSGSTGRPKGVAVEHRQVVGLSLAGGGVLDRILESVAALPGVKSTAGSDLSGASPRLTSSPVIELSLRPRAQAACITA